ncbi:MAG: amino acid adenylation domain-containing protein [Verrucomicrobia bacterium]|nr:amino acid adenylation domain-containing protein [Verrucomicrobiota bacterium]
MSHHVAAQLRDGWQSQPIPTLRRHEPLALSSAQQRLWLLHPLETVSCGCNLAETVRLTGPLDDSALQAALNDIVARHEILRTTYAACEGEPRQFVHPSRPVELATSDLSPLPRGDREAAALALAREEALRPFDLSRDSVLRARLVRRDPTCHWLLLTLHHIAGDAWSLAVLWRELRTAYSARVRRLAPVLPPLPIQYADFAAWQRAWLESESAGQQLAFWREHLAGPVPPLDLPADHPGPRTPIRQGAALRFALPQAPVAALAAVGRQEDATLFMTLLAAFNAFLHRSTGQADFAVGTPVAGRPWAETEPLIGRFVNTLALRADLTGSPTFRQLVQRTRRTALAAFAHQDLPFERVVQDLAPEPPSGQSPLVQVMFALHNAGAPFAEMGGVALWVEPGDRVATLLDLTLELTESRGALEACLTCATDLFAASSASLMRDRFLDLLQQVAASPDAPLGALPSWQPEPQAAAVAAALQDDPDIAECAVLAKQAAQGRVELAAYVVPSTPAAFEPCVARLRQRLPPAQRPSAWVPLSALPLTPDGQVDEAALRALPVLDEELCRRWEAALRSVPGIREVAVAVEHRLPPLPALHITRLLAPEMPIPPNPGPEPDPVPPPRQGFHETSRDTLAPETATDSESSGTGAVLKPALADGGELRVAPNAPQLLADVLSRAAYESTHRLVFLEAAGTELAMTYGTLLDQSQRMLGGLRRLGLKPQDKILFQLDRQAEFVAAFWGCILGGFVPVPVAAADSGDPAEDAVSKLIRAAQVSQAQLVLASPRLAAALKALADAAGWPNLPVATVPDLLTTEPDTRWHRGRPDDVALLMTARDGSGLPRLVMLSHRNLISRTLGCVQLNGLTADDVSLNWMPLDHAAGIIDFHLRDTHVQCQQIHAPPTLVLEHPLQWLDWLETYRVTVTFGSNTAFGLVNDCAAALAEHRWDLSRLRYVLCGGETIVTRTARRFLQLLQPHGLRAMHPVWGMVETGSSTTCSHRFTLETSRDDDPFVEVGAPIPGNALRIAAGDGRVVGEGVIGRVQIRGLTVTRGYYGQPELNRNAFTPDGWFDTGDVGRIRDGRLTVTGHAEERLVIQGVPCHSREIEAAAEQVPGLQPGFTAACAVRMPHAHADTLAVFFAPASRNPHDWPPLARNIRSRVLQQTGATPAVVIPLGPGDLPKTPPGQTGRAQLKTRFERGDFDATRQQMDVLAANANTVPDWFFKRVWIRKNPRPSCIAPGAGAHAGARASAACAEADPGVMPGAGRSAVRAPAGGQAGCAVVFAGNLAVGQAVAQHLPIPTLVVEPGHTYHQVRPGHVRLDPRAPDHYAQLVSSLGAAGHPVRGIVHLWTCTQAATPGLVGGLTGDQALDAQDLGAVSILLLAQALARHQDHSMPVRLLAVSTAVQPVSQNDPRNCLHAGMLGLLKSIPQELPWLQCAHIDLPDAEADEDGAAGVRTLAGIVGAEWRSPCADAEVAYRQGARWVPELRRVAFEEPAAASAFRPQGCYLVSGALGGVGQELARHLLQKYGARLVLTDRLSKTEAAAALRTMAVLGGEVIYGQADVADESQLEAAAAQARRRWQCGLDGVLHLAGLAPERPLLAETRETFRATLRPKLGGAVALQRLLHRHPGAFFVGFSSVNAFFGEPGYAAYAAANRFLDSFVLAEQRHGRRRAACIHWSMWRDLGMNRRYPRAASAQARGFLPASAHRGLQSLEILLAHQHPSALVGLDASHPLIRQAAPDPALSTPFLQGSYTASHHLPPASLELPALPDRFGVPTQCRLLQRPAPLTTPDGQIPQNDRAPTPRQTPCPNPEAAPAAMPAAAPAPPPHGEFPASFAQEALCLPHCSSPGTPVPNIPWVVRLRGPLNVAALEQSFRELVRRHQPLRTTFRLDGERVVQRVAPVGRRSRFKLDVVRAAREADAVPWAAEFVRRPFDVARGPLFRAGLLRLAEDDHVLAVSLHRVICDGWSRGILAGELGRLYARLSAGAAPDLAPLALHYTDWVLAQRQQAQDSGWAAALEYWRGQLQGELPPLDLPTRQPRPAVLTCDGRSLSRRLPAPLVTALTALAEREGATLFMVLLAGFKALLHRYCHQDDIAVGTPVANRPRPETQGLIGLFANTLVLRTRLSGDLGFRELLRRERSVALDASAHAELPFEPLVAALNPRRDPGPSPLLRVLFAFENLTHEDPLLPGLTVSPCTVEVGTAMADLACRLRQEGDALSVTLEYKTDLFEADFIGRMLGHYQTLLDGACAQPDQGLARLPLLTPEERDQILIEWNATDQARPKDRCLHQLVESQAAQTPGAIAVEMGARRLTYRDLNTRADQLARRLQNQGVGPDTLVAVHLERSPEMVVALLAILKAGGAYLPLDPALPRERLAFMLADSGAPLLLTERPLQQRLHLPAPHALCLEDCVVVTRRPEPGLPPPDTPFPRADTPGAARRGPCAGNLAYVLYTPGSNGKSNGVMIPHRAVVNFLGAAQSLLSVRPDDVLLAIAALSLDIAGLEIFLPLANGARIAIASRDDALDGRRLDALIRAHGVTLMQASPDTWRRLLQAGWAGHASLRALCSGGTCPPDLARRLLERVGALWNAYGPPETTIASALHPVRSPETPVPIGRPLANTQFYLLDAAMQPVPVGVPGELFIGGDGLARGYWNRPELTRERFVPNPFRGEPDAQLCRTGDHARYRSDGTLDCLGRHDRQVEWQGHRIELAEIETALAQHPEVRQTAVVAHVNPTGDTRLVAYAVPAPGTAPAAAELRELARRHLPEYMVPAQVVIVPTLPLAPNGNVDTRALPAPASGRPHTTHGLVALRDPIETQPASL